jgi:hypothetical protein
MHLIMFSDFYIGSMQQKEALNQKWLFFLARLIYYDLFYYETRIKA